MRGRGTGTLGATPRDRGGVADARVPAPYAGGRCPRVALSGVELVTSPPWPAAAPVAASLGVTELVAAGLLRRADVRFVERRRFAAAAEAERVGQPRPRGAPAAGVSEGAELVAAVVVAPLGSSQLTVEVRLADATTGAVRSSSRHLLPTQVDPVAVSRIAVRGILDALGTLGRLPPWNDPFPTAAPIDFVPSGVPESAVADFLAGLAAEEAWMWDRARVAYQAAARRVGFVEAGAAQARTARLRLGGTLGEN